jgi:ubiquinone/menaquinone biosynthesis C-methylase UbiE
MARVEDAINRAESSRDGEARMDYDQTSMPSTYDQARAYSPETLDFWLEIISSAIAGTRLTTILDLGCGTGRYSGALAEKFGAQVFAVDPSEKMLAEARRKSLGAVRHLRGSGEHLPIANASMDMVFMSMVYHHLKEPLASAKECHRVLRPDGVVCIRASTADQIEEYVDFRFFPEARPLLEGGLPSTSLMTKTFADAGFSLGLHEVIVTEIAENWESHAEKVALRADSFLSRLGDEEFARGLSRVREYARSAPRGTPVERPVDLFVFRREDL